MEAALRWSLWGRPLYRLLHLLADAPESYENQLARQAPVASHQPARPVTWLVLLLLCLLPRLWMAAKIDTVCPDAVLYLRLAEALDSGNWTAGLEQISLNTFTLILMLLHRLGADLTVAGQWWSVAASTAAVLPIYGFARRQFDERVAVLAAFFYAVHPAIIERTPEVVRDPTYWLLLTLSLYLAWRAITELRWHWFAAAGVCVALTSLTRFEGLFLAIPLAGWMIVRAWHYRAARWRLALGGLIIVLSFPVTVYGIRALWFADAPVAKLVRTDPLDRVKYWLGTWALPQKDTPEEGAGAAASSTAPLTAVTTEAATAPAVAATSPAETAPPTVGSRMSTAEALHFFAQKGIEGFNPFALLAAAVSVLAWWPLARRSDQLPLVALAATILLSSWIHLRFSGELSSRYFISAFLVVAPWSGLGMMWPPSRRLHGLQQWAHDDWRPGAVATVLLVALAVGSWSHAFRTSFASRRQLAEAARWTCHRFGTDAEVWAARDHAALFGFYAQTECRLLEADRIDALVDAVATSQADVVVVPPGKKQLAAALAAAQPRLGLKRVVVRDGDERAKGLVLLVRAGSDEAARMSRTQNSPSDPLK
ncbi:MAG: glycosyltransferase family 39 protein [Pirellulales bacterium]|nr:glycosyltransferase family 39 protein [Pirellulales bacterium]